jgi:hypothetical protein
MTKLDYNTLLTNSERKEIERENNLIKDKLVNSLSQVMKNSPALNESLQRYVDNHDALRLSRPTIRVNGAYEVSLVKNYDKNKSIDSVISKATDKNVANLLTDLLELHTQRNNTTRLIGKKENVEYNRTRKLLRKNRER